MYLQGIYPIVVSADTLALKINFLLKPINTGIDFLHLLKVLLSLMVILFRFVSIDPNMSDRQKKVKCNTNVEAEHVSSWSIR